MYNIQVQKSHLTFPNYSIRRVPFLLSLYFELNYDHLIMDRYICNSTFQYVENINHGDYVVVSLRSKFNFTQQPTSLLGFELLREDIFNTISAFIPNEAVFPILSCTGFIQFAKRE